MCRRVTASQHRTEAGGNNKKRKKNTHQIVHFDCAEPNARLRISITRKMSSYFVNSLFSKYKSGDSLRPNYYECGFAQDLAGSRPTVVYGPGSGATFQHTPQIQDFYHHSASSLPSNPYQQSPCAVTCHGEPGNFYGYDALQRQTIFGTQDADLVQYSDCKLGGATGLGNEDAEGTEQSPSPTQLFPWMRPQGEKTAVPLQWPCLHIYGFLLTLIK